MDDPTADPTPAACRISVSSLQLLIAAAESLDMKWGTQLVSAVVEARAAIASALAPVPHGW